MFIMMRRFRWFLLATFFVLFLSFSLNIFGAVSTDGFLLNYKDSESLVSSQIACKGKLFSDQLVTIKGSSGSNSGLVGCNDHRATAYSSQFGLQGKIYTLGYDIISHFTRMSVGRYIAIAQIITAMATSVVFSVLVLWIRLRFGTIVSVFSLISIALSPMIVGFGRNLYWAEALFVLPFVFVLCFYQNTILRNNKTLLFWTILGFLLYIRYLCGYEYITTITIMPMAAAAYYLCCGGANIKKYSQQFVIFGGVSVLAFFLALITHVGALNLYTGSTSRSLQLIEQRAEVRTIDAGQYTAAPYANLAGLTPDYYRVSDSYLHYGKHTNSGSILWASIVALSTYALLPVVQLPVELTPSLALYAQSMTTFTALLVILYLTRKKWISQKKILLEVDALYMAASVGFIGYLSWLVIGFSHSLVHAHINGILMYLPFALFGYMIMGIFIRQSIVRFKLKKIFK